MLSSLVVAEANAVVHRDLKPENVAGGDWTIIDLSGAVDVSTFPEQLQQGLVDQAVGTWGYMAPELQRFMLQRGGSKEEAVAMTTSKLDVYSYGVIGYQLLTGCLPPAAGRGPLTFPPITAPDWPHQKEVQAFITSCLQADPEQRPTFAQLQQRASGWLQPWVQLADGPGRGSTHPIRLANANIKAFYSSKQAQLRPWARHADRLSKPLSLLQRAMLALRKKLAVRKQLQQQQHAQLSQQQQQQPVQAMQPEVEAAAQPETSVAAVSAACVASAAPAACAACAGTRRAACHTGRAMQRSQHQQWLQHRRQRRCHVHD